MLSLVSISLRTPPFGFQTQVRQQFADISRICIYNSPTPHHPAVSPPLHLLLPMPKFIEIYANLANEKPTDTRAHTQGPTRGRARTGSAPERDMERLKEKLSVSLSTTSLLVQHLNWKRGRKTNQSGMRVATPQLSFYFSPFFSFSLNRSLIVFVFNFSAFDDMLSLSNHIRYCRVLG